MWLSYSLGSKIPFTDFERRYKRTCFPWYSDALWMERLPSSRNECTSRPRSPSSLSSAKSFNFKIDGHFERKNSDITFQELPEIEEKALLGKPFLGSWLFCKHSWFGWRNHKKICKISRKRRTSGWGPTTAIWFLTIKPPLGAAKSHLLRRCVFYFFSANRLSIQLSVLLLPDVR